MSIVQFRWIKVFRADASLLKRIEKIGGYSFLFTKTYFRQYEAGKHNKMYIQTFILESIYVALMFVSIALMILVIISMFPELEKARNHY